MDTVRRKEIGRKGLVSLVVAVSGHRDIHPEDRTHVKPCLRSILLNYARDYPHTPILVVTGMAEGADQIAVEAVRELQAEGHERICYTPLLPMPEDLFLENFKTGAGREMFRDQMTGQTVARLPVHPGNSWEQVKVEGSAEQRQQYRDLARVLVQASQVLIAVWDDEDTTRRVGGTWEVVSRKRGDFPVDHEVAEEGRRHVMADSLDVSPLGTGLTHHIFVRKGDRELTGAAKRVTEILPQDTELKDYTLGFLLLDEYNRDVLHHLKLAGKVEEDIAAITQNYSLVGMTQGMIWSSGVRSWATELSTHYKNRNARAWIWMFGFLFLMGVALHLIEIALKDERQFLKPVTLFYYISTAIALFLWLRENGYIEYRWRRIRSLRWFRDAPVPVVPRERLKFRRKHEDYRALAEALRVQFYWLAAGLDTLACESYLDKHAGDMIWVRDATSEIVLRRCRDTTGPQDAHRLSRSLGEEWLTGQIHFFQREERDRESRVMRVERVRIVFVLLTVLEPIGLYVYVERFHGASETMTLFTLVPSLLLLAGVMLSDYLELQGEEQMAQQYRQMHTYYKRALKELNELLKKQRESGTDKVEEIRDLLWHVGIRALGENGDWLALHRGRDLKLSRGGGG